MQINKSIMTYLVMLSISSGAVAIDAQDIVTGSKGSEPVRSEKFGTCVQTKWNAASDPCAPAKKAEVKAEPKPEPVAVAPAPEPVAQLGHEQLSIYFDFNKSVV
ncbi:MAG: hypothetical protein WCJ33_07110, partial [Pseudomonadota bacterium]